MIPFVVIVIDELVERASQGTLADQDHALEAGFLDGAHEAFGKRIQVRGAGREPDRRDAGGRERVADRLTVQRVAVVNEHPRASQESIFGIGGVPHQLRDPRPFGLGADAGDLDAARGQFDL